MAKVTDPVCKMQVDTEKTPPALQSEYEGKKYYFCAPGCKRMFDKNPEQYVKPKQTS